MKRLSILFILFILFTIGFSVSIKAHDKKAPSDTSGLSIEQHLDLTMTNAERLSVLTVTFAPNYTEPSHTHPGDEVIYVVKGEGRLWLDGKAFSLKAGDLHHVKSGSVKAIENISSTTPLVVIAYLALEAGKPTLTLTTPGDDQ